MMNIRSGILLLSLPFTGYTLYAQMDAPEVHHEAEFKQREVTLMQDARKNVSGEADVTLQASSNRKLMLVARTKSGEAEIHTFWTDEVVIRSGEATMVVGGTMSSPFPYGTGEGEFHAKSIDKPDKEIALHAGDILHVPPNTPHWMKLKPGATVTYIVFKAR
jgi:mannose-6-phosphate isomerase-like protein (cupin superfamily)